MKPAIRVEGLGKRYRLGTARSDNNLTEALWSATGRIWRGLVGRGGAAAGADEFWALDDVSFEVWPGEVVGIVGRNGAGKSTLLKVLSRIVEPTAGRAEVRGRMGSLLEVGTGFHPELTGRENVYLNGSILGMSRREITRKFDEIVDFSGVERFLDTPVKRYSSGMYVRLAFAVAAHLDLETLVVDEVLAVGDAAFQAKCTQRMRAASQGGRTVLFVSHNMPAVQNLCGRCVWLKGGRVAADGPTAEVLAGYGRDTAGAGGTDVDLTRHPGRTADSVPALTRVRVAAADEAAAAVRMGGGVRVEIEFDSPTAVADVVCGVVVKDPNRAPVFGVNNLVVPTPPLPGPTRTGRATCLLENLPLMPGRYSLDLYFGTLGRDTDVVHDAADLTVEPADVFGSGRLPGGGAGPVFWPARWELTRVG